MDNSINQNFIELTDFVYANFKEMVLEKYKMLKDLKYNLEVRIKRIEKEFDEKNVLILDKFRLYLRENHQKLIKISLKKFRTHKMKVKSQMSRKIKI